MSHTATQAGPRVSVLYDSADARVVLLTLRPGQGLPLHRTPADVMLRVLRGRGVFTRSGDQRSVVEGSKLSVEPNEAYALRAEREPLTVLATVTPRSGWSSGA
jgi:quercetin dioxygenase-like cupin family protein